MEVAVGKVLCGAAHINFGQFLQLLQVAKAARGRVTIVTVTALDLAAANLETTCTFHHLHSKPSLARPIP